MLCLLLCCSCTAKKQEAKKSPPKEYSTTLLKIPTLATTLSRDIAVTPGTWNTLLDEYCKSQYSGPVWQDCFVDKAIPSDVITGGPPEALTAIISAEVTDALFKRGTAPDGAVIVTGIKTYCQELDATLMKFRMVSLGEPSDFGDALISVDIRYDGKVSPFSRVTYLYRFTWK